MTSYTVAIPTVGRPSLRTLLAALDDGAGPRPDLVLVVDDRADARVPLAVTVAADLPVKVLRGAAAGPAAARNVAWRAAGSTWVAFLDDDVVPDPDWAARLAEDLDGLPVSVAGSQGRVHVPLPAHRRPTDWERATAGLADARWATADMAYRRATLAAVGGFDERFPRAYREDADLGLRVTASGRRIQTGARRVTHPVRPAGRWASVRAQAGNADDALMRRLHGPAWRERAGADRGRRSRHLATTASGVAGLTALAARGPGVLAAAGLAGWLAGTVAFAWARVAPGPRTAGETATMLATSAVIPPAATWHWLRGAWRARGAAPRDAPRDASRNASRNASLGRRPVRAVLFDRDGTLVDDVPYNADPDRVVVRPGAREALDRLRRAGLPLAVVTNQSGIGRGLLSAGEVEAVNRRTEQLLGPLGPWCVCPHAPDAGCDCRKPRGGLVLRAAAALGVDPAECVVVGDIGADVEAALAAGAQAVLVPTPVTRDDEVAAAPAVARSLLEAVDRILTSARPW